MSRIHHESLSFDFHVAYNGIFGTSSVQLSHLAVWLRIQMPRVSKYKICTTFTISYKISIKTGLFRLMTGLLPVSLSKYNQKSLWKCPFGKMKMYHHLKRCKETQNSWHWSDSDWQNYEIKSGCWKTGNEWNSFWAPSEFRNSTFIFLSIWIALQC